MRRLLCFVFGHKCRMLRRITSAVRELYCKRCKSQFAMNDHVQALLPLTGEFVELHNEMLRDNLRRLA